MRRSRVQYRLVTGSSLGGAFQTTIWDEMIRLQNLNMKRHKMHILVMQIFLH